VHHFIEDGINVDEARPGRNFDTLAVRELAIVRNLTGLIRLSRVLSFGTGVVTERDWTTFSVQKFTGLGNMSVFAGPKRVLLLSSRIEVARSEKMAI
jgi:hypothetical protein